MERGEREGRGRTEETWRGGGKWRKGRKGGREETLGRIEGVVLGVHACLLHSEQTVYNLPLTIHTFVLPQNSTSVMDTNTGKLNCTTNQPSHATHHKTHTHTHTRTQHTWLCTSTQEVMKHIYVPSHLLCKNFKFNSTCN